jgi:hypothetical protein
MRGTDPIENESSKMNTAVISEEMDEGASAELLRAEIVRWRQENEELKRATHAQGSKTATSPPPDQDPDDIGMVPPTIGEDNFEARGYAYQLAEIARWEQVLEERKRAIHSQMSSMTPVVDADTALQLPLKIDKSMDRKNPRILFNRFPIEEEDGRKSNYLSELNDRVKKAELINHHGMMDGDKLLALVQGATNEGCQEYRPQRAAQTTNMIQESLELAKECGEMFLQQVVYSPIAELFSCFDLRKYCADQRIECAHIVRCQYEQGKEDWHSVACNPDAAIKLLEDFYLIAMMQLKASRNINYEDMYRCKFMTCVSLLALVKYLGTGNLSLAMPFVLGNHDEALLYVTRFVRVDGVEKIVFTLLKSLKFSSVHFNTVKNYDPLTAV